MTETIIDEKKTIEIHDLPRMKFQVSRALGDSEQLLMSLEVSAENSDLTRDNMAWLLEQAATLSVVHPVQQKPPGVG